MQADVRIVALVPAHNEADLIEQTLESLVNQTRPPDKVLVIADNCTDATTSIVRDVALRYPEQDIEFFETVGNRAKKAGALNQGLARLQLDEWDFILQMDADTELDLRLVEEALAEFARDPLMGGVASRCFPKPCADDTSLVGRALWNVQNIEYGMADSRNIERGGQAKVLSGAVCLYRREVLMAAAELNEQPEGSTHLHVWPEQSLVEDYEITLNVQKLGYHTEIGMRMFSATDAMLTLRDLKNQRFRWYGGQAGALRRRGFAPEIRREALVQCFYILVILVRLIVFTMIGALIALTIAGDPPVELKVSWWMLGVFALILVNYIYRFRFVRNKTLGQWLTVLLIIPIELYITWDQGLTLVSYTRNLVRPSSAW